VILITTSDYSPKVGGLSTFTDNIEQALKKLNIEYDLFHWKNVSEISKFDSTKLDQYEKIINIHPMFSINQSAHHEKMINFVHGSEVLMTSPNILKRIVKWINKSAYFRRLSHSMFNVFISEYTLNKIEKLGYQADYSKDLIFHNCIDLKNAQFINQNLAGEQWVLTCFVRNVPHKNLSGAVKLAECLSEFTSKKLILILPKGSKRFSSKIEIEELSDFEEETREKAYRKAHFNLLLSLDHSSKGFVEGFGLTVLEAGKYGVPSIVFNTGGLPEAVHANQTGFILNSLSELEIEKMLLELKEMNYEFLRKNVYTHTHSTHGLNQYEKLLRKLLGS